MFLEEVSNDEFPVYSGFFCWVQYPKNMSKNGCFEVSRVFVGQRLVFFNAANGSLKPRIDHTNYISESR